jgi:hypothetical protein
LLLLNSSLAFDLRIIPIIAVVIIAMASHNIRLSDYCGFTCSKIDVKKTCILAKVKFNHL